MKVSLSINIDWAKAYGWRCPFCRSEIDHLNEERNEAAGYTDDSYWCPDRRGAMCEDAFFMVRWSHTERGANGDAKTLRRWIEVELDAECVNKDEQPAVVAISATTEKTSNPSAVCAKNAQTENVLLHRVEVLGSGDKMNVHELRRVAIDAETMTLMRGAIEKLRDKPAWGFDMAMEYVAPRDERRDLLDCANAALREIDRLTAELEALRAECEDVPMMLLWGAGALEERCETERADRVDAKVVTLSAVLGIESD